MSKTAVSISERRKYFRLQEEHLVTCEVFSLPRNSATRAKIKTKDISAGGILFESEEAYPLGTLLCLEIQVIGWDRYKPEFYKRDALSRSEPLVVIGDVVRLERIADKRYDIGVSMSGIDAGHKIALAKYIKIKSE